MKQAILITAYRDFRHLTDLVCGFDDRFDIFIHIDRKSRVDEEVMRWLQACRQVKEVRQVFTVNWGGRHHVDAILWLCRRVRPLPPHPVYGGSTWWSLTREAVTYICDNYNRDGWYDRLADTFVPEEMYVQTLLLNSPLKDTVVNDNLRYILWEARHGSVPAVLDESDVEALCRSGAMFARKVDSEVSEKLIRTINSYRNHGI